MRYLNPSYIFGLVYMGARVVAGVIVAYYMHKDASRKTIRFLSIPPAGWAIIGLAAPAMGLIAYWLLNCYRIAESDTANVGGCSEANEEESEESV